MFKELELVIQFAKERLAHDGSGHGFDHAKRVAQLAKRIITDLGDPAVDEFVVLAAAYLHDTIDDKVVASPEIALEELREYLTMIGVDSTQILEIIFIMDNLSFSKEIFGKAAELTINGQIVQDADRLEALGAIGILRTAYYGGSHGSILHDPTIAPRKLTSKAQYREDSTVINHFYEKLYRIVDLMKTPYGKKEGQRRKAFMETFLAEFYEEWDL
ncbi:HD domain-containing protein [Enterococcus diestrammenae]|uniref:HD/PDEase domain-containing protein n=1 Tax=Enterococcus diestrammenae TaxID=1155073 RepID=A0ABV0F1X6_9ENTE|nr:HD domain-containing protein [Enterococcus diestrammenae]KAF1295296.1 metal-dependent phosphohydrolase [Enterococcus diestrammenae]